MHLDISKTHRGHSDSVMLNAAVCLTFDNEREGIHHEYSDFAIRTSIHSEFVLRKSMKTDEDHITVTSDTLLRIKNNCIKLGSEARRVINEPNAGGKSVISETLSAEYMCRRFNAHSIVPEMTIGYLWSNWKKIDYIVTMFGERVGVSVTRAMGFPDASTFTFEDAQRLCYKKLHGLVVARTGISSRFSYTRSILHCFCQNELISLYMRAAFEELIEKDKQLSEDSQLTGQLSIILTVCSTVSGIYSEDFACVEAESRSGR